jgi:acetoin utilization protein AcuB
VGVTEFNTFFDLIPWYQKGDAKRDLGGRMVSILTSYEKVPDGFRKVYIRFFDLDRSVLETLKKNLFEISKVLYIVDHRENKREIFET